MQDNERILAFWLPLVVALAAMTLFAAAAHGQDPTPEPVPTPPPQGGNPASGGEGEPQGHLPGVRYNTSSLRR